MKNIVLYSLMFSTVISATNCKPGITDNLPVCESTILSFINNPSGNWQIGYSTGSVLDTGQFALCTFAGMDSLIGIWHPSGQQAGYYPYTGQNNTGSTQVDATLSWTARPGEIVMEGSGSGQYSMLRFRVPLSGKYRIKVIFEGVHFRLSTTDVHVLLNAQSLFSDNINGYGGDSLFHAIVGPHPTSTYKGILQLQQNDELTFAVGYGSDGTNYNDTTGLLIYIELVG
jgi:hypothetical protein